MDPSFSDLNYCLNDVLALAETLAGLGYTVVVLHDQADQERLRPTRDNIEAELAALCRAAGPDDLLLVHFADHGFLVEGAPVLITREIRASTIDDLKTYPLDNLRRWNVEQGFNQEPTARTEGLGDMILADFRPPGSPSLAA